jgi:hypothetical protein
MPVSLEWHPSLPILQATYKGILSANEYFAMCRQRSEMLEKGPGQIVLVVDAQQMEGFPDAGTAKRGEDVSLHDRVYRTLIVLPEDVYRRVSRTIVTDDSLPVWFYSTIDRARDTAETLTARSS